MTYDGELDIAIGLSARSKVWSNKKLKWSELVSRLGEENKTTETFKEFVSASKEDQLKIQHQIEQRLKKQGRKLKPTKNNWELLDRMFRST